MAAGLAVLAFLAALLDWYAVWKGKRQWRYLSKPLPMILLLGAVWVFRPGLAFPLIIFVVGLAFGLVGDVLLLFHGNLFFLGGLITFLAGHLCYIVGFNVEAVTSSWVTMLFLIPVAVSLGIFSRKVIPFAEKKMRIAVWAYAIVIVTMMYSALLTSLRVEWSVTAVVLAIIGSCLFVTSDTMLAFDRFLKRRYGLWVMVTYHLAQMAIIAAAVIQYG